MSSTRTKTGVLAVLVLAIDQATKALVRGSFAPCSVHDCAQVRIGPLSILNQTNTGGAFSLRSGSGVWVLLALLSVLIVPVYGKRLGRAGGRSISIAVALGLLAGGGLGNLLDRIRFGGVTDFLVPGGYVTMNLADVAALAGTVLTIRLLVRELRAGTQLSRQPA